jgi:DNA mismatch repair ATPase MutS
MKSRPFSSGPQFFFQRFGYLFGIYLVVLPSFVWFSSVFLETPFSELKSVRIMSLVSLLLGLFLLQYWYLQGQRQTSLPASPDLNRLYYEIRQLLRSQETGGEVTELIAEIRALSNQLKAEKPNPIALAETDMTTLLNSLRDTLASILSKEFLTAIDSNYGTTAIHESRFARLVDDLQALRRRLLDEIDTLQRRANSNLAIGTVTTLLAMVSLAYVVLSSPKDYTTTTAVLGYFLPRLSFAIFIEVFSFFFLRLYKTNLGDVKFYQNELTNVDARLVALEAALIDDNRDGLKELLAELARTERNFVLKKGETTVDLERRRLDEAERVELLERLGKFVDKIKAKG